jgi:hypothetical protein
MKKPIKRMIALMKGSDESRAQFKAMMIDAQLSEEAARRSYLRSKDSRNTDLE